MRPTPRVVYFHGMPGSPVELKLFGSLDPAWAAFDRGQLPRELSAPQRFERLAGMVGDCARDGPVRVVAFSLGAYVALEVASRLPELPLTLDLISPAAPLQLGAFLESMAGAAVFSAARRTPAYFRALAFGQSLAARLGPRALAAALFASAQGGDIALRDDGVFRNGITEGLQDSLLRGRANYVCEIESYVGDWSAILGAIRQPVSVWQGAADNWTPPAMAEALVRALPDARATVLPGLSHYSTLKAALGKIAGD